MGITYREPCRDFVLGLTLLPWALEAENFYSHCRDEETEAQRWSEGQNQEENKRKQR